MASKHNIAHYGKTVKLILRRSLSIAFKPEFEQIDGARFVRCSEIYSADIVDSPASNPAGLFSKNNTEDVEDTDNSDKADEDANDEDVKLSEVHKIVERYNADLAGVKERLKLMASTVAAINNKIDSAKIELLSRVEAEFSSKLTEQAKRAALAASLNSRWRERM